MSKSFSAEIPPSIMSLDQPLFPDQSDRSHTLSVTAGSIHQHPIQVTVCVYYHNRLYLSVFRMLSFFIFITFVLIHGFFAYGRVLSLIYRMVVILNGYLIVMTIPFGFLFFSKKKEDRKSVWWWSLCVWKAMVVMICRKWCGQHDICHSSLLCSFS